MQWKFIESRLFLEGSVHCFLRQYASARCLSFKAFRLFASSTDF